MKEYSKSEIENGIDEWIIGRNGKRNRLILKLKLIDGLSYTEIADELSSDKYPETYRLEVRQIQRVIRKTEDILFRHI